MTLAELHCGSYANHHRPHDWRWRTSVIPADIVDEALAWRHCPGNLVAVQLCAVRQRATDRRCRNEATLVFGSRCAECGHQEQIRSCRTCWSLMDTVASCRKCGGFKTVQLTEAFPLEDAR